MWYIPTHRVFVADSQVFSGVEKLQSSLFHNLQLLSLLLIGWVHTSKFKEEILVSWLTNVLRHLLHHLEFISTGFFTMCLGVHKMQRIDLEFTGLLNYMEHYCLWSMSLGTIDSIIGAFTHDSLICWHSCLVHKALLCPHLYSYMGPCACNQGGQGATAWAIVSSCLPHNSSWMRRCSWEVHCLG
jgi:hypothetical protein